MTRVNGHIKPEDLCDEHLLAEYHEILRINDWAAYRARKQGESMLKDIQQVFTLGKGHVTFFYDKLKYIHLRFESLKEELLRRNVNVKVIYDPKVSLEFPWLYNDWNTSKEADRLLVTRILERASSMKKLSYNKKPLTIELYTEMLSLYS